MTGARLIKYGLAPAIKQAFEEIFKAPYITKLLLAELGHHQHQDHFFTIDYDGTFEEQDTMAVLGAAPHIEDTMREYLKTHVTPNAATLQAVLDVAARAWALGALTQSHDNEQSESSSADTKETGSSQSSFSEEQILEHLQTGLKEKTLECAVLERQAPGSSKYRTLGQQEILSHLPLLNKTPN